MYKGKPTPKLAESKVQETLHFRYIPEILGDSKWLGSIPFISHLYRPFGRGPTTRSLENKNDDHHGY